MSMDHMYRLTKEDLMLLQPSGFIWLSYIPRESFPNWLNQSHFIEASIGTDLLGLTVHKCGFRLLYQNDETEFKETITRLSQTQEDKATDPSSTSALMIPGLKTRAKES
ncbi:hypothetical protein FH972_018274 [Carpinus fangiana]|uniref:Uncharacterized protein n=1 Tax=Carpinus fangiana TaxID=176857 RepID=A0A5N6RPH8_9ROSI|nr:hypothetical protein FH972_018274 [Carpinus fangiana]